MIEITIDAVTAGVRHKYNRNAGWFDRMDRMLKPEFRRLVVGQAAGRVLEIGIGTGKNLEYYSPDCTKELIGIDLSPGMLAKAREKKSPVPVTLLEMDAQRLTFPDHFFDTVVATCVFCTVPDPVAGLREAMRVCKPGGQVVLLEHVRLEHPLLGRMMDLLDPLTVAMVGTHINRRTVENVRQAGLTVDRVDAVRGQILKLIHARP